MIETTFPVLAVAAHRHGLRVIFPLIVVAAIVTIVVLLIQRSRDRRVTKGASPRDRGEPPPPPVPAVPSTDPARPTGDPRPSATPPDARSNRLQARPGDDRLVIDVDGLTKHYGDKVAVDGLTFAVTPGHVTGFLGPNGAGKSTTMRLIMGLDLPDRGSVTVSGRPYHGLSWPLHEMGALLEAKAIHPGRSADAHLSMLARSNHIPRRRVDEVLDIVGLTQVARQRAGQFSLGMTQRLGIAAALLGDPGILMFDEPVNGLDTDGIRWVRSLVRRLASEGRTVFVSSHLMSEMALMADHVVVIGKGRLIADMPMDEFTSLHSRRTVRVRSPQLDRLLPALQAMGAEAVPEADGSVSVHGASADQIGEVAWRQSILLHELSPQSASLEQAFIESTEGDLEYRGGVSVGADEGAKERPT